VGKVLVSIVMATLNEENHIEVCLKSLLSQRDLPGECEILVYDGGSGDRTVAIVQDFAGRDPRIRLLMNPKRRQVYAYNLGLKEAHGAYIAIVGAHAEYDSDYISTCLALLNATGASNVGGIQTPIGKGPVGRAIAWAMSSPLGVGGARFRYTDREEFSDSCFSFFCRRETLEKAGGFDERYVFDEDWELNYRLRQAGGKILVSPRIRVRYFTRNSLKGLALQMFRYGYWRAHTHRNRPGSFRKGHAAPPLLVAGTLASLVWLLIGHSGTAAFLPAIYALYALAGGSVSLLRSRSLRVAILAPLVLATMHFSWGVGWWLGVRRFGFPNSFRFNLHDSALGRN